MKIVHISTYPNGGAGNAAYRLHDAILDQGVDSKVITRAETLDKREVYAFNPSIWFRRLSTLWKAIKILPKVLKEDKDCEGFTSPLSLYRIEQHRDVQEADIVIVHWASNFIDYPSFFKNINKPVYIFLHDMNHFHGGYHYKNDVTRFTQYHALEEKFVAIKKKAYQYGDIEVMAPSNWMIEASKNSELLGRFKHTKCYYALNENNLKPYDNAEARAHFGLPKEGKVLLFIAERISNYRKGAKLLFEALQKVKFENTHLLVVGNYDESIFHMDNIYTTGVLKSEKEMALAYSASDLFILPSREDNLPNVMLESLYCGTPIITFSNGGMNEIIKESNGILLDEISSDRLADGLTSWMKENKDYDRALIRRNAVELFNIETAGRNLKQILEERLKKEIS